MEKELVASWESLMKDLRIPSNSSRIFWLQLKEKYGEKHRSYHNLNHIDHFLTHYNDHVNKVEQPELFQLAIWYHDSIYDVESHDNEHQSALYFSHCFAPYLSEKDKVHIESIIRSTHKHIPNLDTFDNALFLDLDLSILGSDRTDYIQYINQIEKEYTTVYSIPAYKTGRYMTMEKFLVRERIYYTDCFYEWGEKKARDNIKFELEKLKKERSSN